MFKGAIFDMDGTLLDSMGLWEDIGDRFLKSVNIKPEPGLADALRNMSFDDALIYFSENYDIKMTFTEFMKRVNEIAAEYYKNESEAKEGVKEFLADLKEKNIKMAIATLTNIDQVKIALEHCGILHYFSSIVTCSMVNASKKFPDVYRKALENIGTEKEETIVFEDVYHAVKTVKQDGFRVAAIKDKYADYSEKIKETADFYIESYNDLDAFWKWAIE